MLAEEMVPGKDTTFITSFIKCDCHFSRKLYLFVCYFNTHLFVKLFSKALLNVLVIRKEFCVFMSHNFVWQIDVSN